MYHSFRLLFLLSGWSALTLVLSGGCAAAIAYTGQDIKQLETRDQVQESFGKPAQMGEAKDYSGKTVEFDEFRTRRKISEPLVAEGHFFLDLVSLGLLEPVALLAQAGQTSWATVFGQTLRFEYDEDNRVKEIYINGARLEHRRFFP